MAVQPQTRSQPLETLETIESPTAAGETATGADAGSDALAETPITTGDDVAARDASASLAPHAEDAPLAQGDATNAPDEDFSSDFASPLVPAFRVFTWSNLALAGVVVALIVVIVVGVVRAVIPATPTVTLYTVQNQTLTNYVGGGGLTYPAQSLTITYPANATVLSVNVQVGQSVQKGQQILQLNSADLNSQLQQAYTAWQAAQQYVNTLYADGAPPALIASAQAQSSLAKSHYDALNTQLNSPAYSNGNVIAPFNGVVSEVDVTPGMVASAGRTLVILQNASKVIVRAQMPLAQRSQVQIGQNVLLSPDATPNQTFYGQVTTINPTLTNAGSDTFEVWVTVPNPNLQLLLNESVYVRIQSSLVAPSVPELAVINPDADSIVYVYANGRAHVRHVVVGVRDGDHFGIVSGLRPGDIVILVGQYQLTDNEPVNVRH